MLGIFPSYITINKERPGRHTGAKGYIILSYHCLFNDTQTCA